HSPTIQKGLIVNTYFQSFLLATSNGKFPELSDMWRLYHKTSSLIDNEYSLFSSTSNCSEEASLRADEEQPIQSRKLLPANHVYF
ncbi:MAG: hypothetical protein KDF59_01585, partial [Nitrosomonas sp.]|nr:hypothetical protein [Nitrosomonas sp.]